MPEFKLVRPYKQGEEEILGAWILDEGWDASTYDVISQLRVDPNSLFVAADVKDRPIGTHFNTHEIKNAGHFTVDVEAGVDFTIPNAHNLHVGFYQILKIITGLIFDMNNMF